MGLEAVLPGPQNALYVMLCYVMLLLVTHILYFLFHLLAV